MLAVAGLMLGSGVGGAWAAANFSDVRTGHPFYDEIYWAADRGIVEGYPDGTFRPTNPVSRQAATAFLQRYNAEIEVIDEYGNSPYASGGTVSATCPGDKRPIAGDVNLGIGDAVLTDTYIIGQSWYASWTTKSGASAPVGIYHTQVTCLPKT